MINYLYLQSNDDDDDDDDDEVLRPAFCKVLHAGQSRAALAAGCGCGNPRLLMFPLTPTLHDTLSMPFHLSMILISP